MRSAIILGVLLTLLGCSSADTDRRAIAQTLHNAFDRPNAILDIEPIVVRQSYAIAGWVQGDTGGRALLRHERGQWTVITQAGEELRDAQFLRQAGVPQAEASALANVLITAEKRVPEARLALFDRYGGNVRR
jgi:hypothetical protein